jgi:hypothetical protein
MIRSILKRFGYYPCDWFYTCGRCFLEVNGYVVVLETQQCFDENFGTNWTRENIKEVLEKPAQEN